MSALRILDLLTYGLIGGLALLALIVLVIRSLDANAADEYEERRGRP